MSVAEIISLPGGMLSNEKRRYDLLNLGNVLAGFPCQRTGLHHRRDYPRRDLHALPGSQPPPPIQESSTVLSVGEFARIMVVPRAMAGRG